MVDVVVSWEWSVGIYRELWEYLGMLRSMVPAVFPVNVNATKEGAIPFHGDCVVFFQSCLEMKDVVARCGFDAKVIDCETEADVLPYMAP